MKVIFTMYNKDSGSPANIIKLDNNKFTYECFGIVSTRSFLEVGEVTSILYKAGWRY